MGTISYCGFRAQANRTIAALRAGQRSVRLHLSARRPERPKPGGPSLAAADTHTAALDFQRKLAELTGKMLRKKLFMVTFTSKVGMAELFPLLPSHLEYMIALARKGVLFAAGPVNTESGAPTGGGMALLNTATADDARRYMEGEPFYRKGLRSFEIHEWIFMEGSMTVTLNFAEGALSVT
jgi:uncharacterized protein YciI